MREQIGSASPTVRTLATKGPTNIGSDGQVRQRSWGSPLPAWHELQPGEGSYAALYPFGWMSYTPFQTDVSMRFFSPIVAREDRRTSLPVAYFDVRIANHTDEPATVSTMFTMPNAPAHVAGTNTDGSAPAGPPSVRTGLNSRYSERDGVTAVTLSADDPANTPDAAQSEWTIAAKPGPGQKVSYVTSWSADGDGSDIYTPFSTSGGLPNAALGASASAGAVAVSAKLKPGEVTTIPFALAWDFPQVGFDDNQTIWMRRYTNFYGARETATNDYVAGSYPFHQSSTIARDALVEHDANLAAVLGWWQPIATESAYPKVLRTAALNQLHQLVFNNSFWEGGLVSNTVVPTGFTSAGPGNRLGASHPGSHLFGIQDTGAGGISGLGQTDDIQSYAYRGYFLLFPNLQRDRLAASIEATGLTVNGNAPDLYTSSRNPFILWGNPLDSPLQGGTDSRPPKPGETQWLDSPGKFMFEWYAFSKLTGDDGFLRLAYPAMKAEIAFLQGTIPAGAHLPLDPEMFANIYNVVPQEGFGLYNSQLYLLALEIGIAAGTQLGDDAAYIDKLKDDLAKAKAEFELLLWNPAQGYYRFTTAGLNADALFIDAFFAQHLAQQIGLPDLLDVDHYKTHLTRNYPAFRRYDAEGEPTGAPMLVQPAGLESPDGWFPLEASWAWVGTDYVAAADYFAAGTRFELPQLRSYAIELASAVASEVWLDEPNGFAFDPPCGYVADDPTIYAYPAYSQAMGIWDLIDAIKPISVPPNLS